MIAWIFLLACIISGGFLLARPDRFSFRGAALVGFLLLALGMTSPLALHPFRMMLASGSGTDAFIGIWNLWWTRMAVTLGMDPLETSWLFHPNGTSLALHTYSLTYGIASLPLQWLGSVLTGAQAGSASSARPLFLVYNLLLISSFTLTAYFTYRLALLETNHRLASLLAGIIFAYTNYRFANTVRLHIIATELLVLVVWAWASLLRRPSPARLAGLAGSAVLLAYGSLEYSVYAAMLCLLLAAPFLAGAVAARSAPAWVGEMTRPRGRRWFQAAGILGGGILLLLPLVLHVAARLREGGAHFDPRLATYFSADILDFFLPNPRHPLWGGLFAPITAGFHAGDGGFGLSLGWIVLALFTVSALAIARARRGRIWLWSFALFWVLSLGPALHLAGQIHEGFPLPQALLSRLAPLLAGSRTPIRYMAPGGLCLALTVACGWAALRRRQGFGDRPVQGHTEVLIGALILFECLAAPLPLAAVPIPEVYTKIEAQPGSSALMEIPGMPAREELLYQTIHGQRLVQDLSFAVPLRSRRGPDPFATSQWNTLTRGLGSAGYLASLPESPRQKLVGDLRGFLRQYGIRWVVVVQSRPVLDENGKAFRQNPVAEGAAYAALRENLRVLQPLRETECGSATLFEFETSSLRP